MLSMYLLDLDPNVMIWVPHMCPGKRVWGGGARGVHSLLYFAYTCVHDLFIGGIIYLAKRIIM